MDKAAKSEYNKKYYQENKEALKSWQRRYYQCTRESQLEMRRVNYKKNAEKLRIKRLEKREREMKITKE